MVAFADLKNQTALHRYLTGALAHQRLGHFLIFLGTKGVGKTTAATLLAQRLLCKNPRQLDGCGQCSECKKLRNGNHPDFLRIEKEEERKQLREESCEEIFAMARVKPSAGGWRVMVIEDGDTMTSALANSLLKWLEEPFAHTLVILEATSRRHLLPTILSRGQAIQFSPADETTMNSAVDMVAGADEDDKFWLSAVAGGSLGILKELAGSEAWRGKKAMSDQLQFQRQYRSHEVLQEMMQLFKGASDADSRQRAIEFLDLQLHVWRCTLKQGATVAQAAWLRAAIALTIDTQEYLYYNGNLELGLDYLLAKMTDRNLLPLSIGG